MTTRRGQVFGWCWPLWVRHRWSGLPLRRAFGRIGERGGGARQGRGRGWSRSGRAASWQGCRRLGWLVTVWLELWFRPCRGCGMMPAGRRWILWGRVPYGARGGCWLRPSWAVAVWCAILLFSLGGARLPWFAVGAPCGGAQVESGCGCGGGRQPHAVRLAARSCRGLCCACALDGAGASVAPVVAHRCRWKTMAAQGSDSWGQLGGHELA